MAVKSQVSTATVSPRGQTTLPAALRHRWGIQEGGKVTVVDLGGVALILPGGEETARAELRRVLLGGAYETGVGCLDDSDLVDQ